MTGRTHRRFWKHFDALPEPVQKLAREKYALWKRDPHHTSLRFEERRNRICVVRIGEHYRALGLREVRINSHLQSDRFAGRIQDANLESGTWEGRKRIRKTSPKDDSVRWGT